MKATIQKIKGIINPDSEVIYDDDLVNELVYYAKRDAWISACEWFLLSLKNKEEKPDCERAFNEYIKASKI